MPLYDRVQRGQKLKIRADQWNALVAAAERVDREATDYGNTAQAATVHAPNVVIIKNESGQRVPRFGVLEISGPVHDPTDEPERLEEFVTKLALRGRRPAGPVLNIVVALEPILPGKFGRAVASGVFACRVDVCSTGHQFAVAKANDVTTLQSAQAGPIQLLWKHGPGAAQWAIAAM